MGLLANIVGAVARPPILPDPPLHEQLAVRLVEAENAVPALATGWRNANFAAETRPGPETAEALKVAAAALSAGNERVDALRQALEVARERDAQEAEAEAAREHTRAIKTLEAHLTTLRRKGKTLSAHLDNAVRTWSELLEAVEEIAKLWPKASRSRLPAGHMLGMVELKNHVIAELHRLTAIRDEVAWAQIGNPRHFMGIRPGALAAFPSGHRQGAGHLPSMEAMFTQAATSMINIARTSPPVHIAEPVAPTSVPVTEAPALPNKVTADQVPDLERLKQLHAAEMAEQVNPGPQSIEQLKEVWLALQDDAVEPPDGQELTALKATAGALHLGDDEVLVELQTAAQTDKEPIQ